MTENALLIFIPDSTYGHGPDETWNERSRALKEQLESEFEIPLEETGIGPGFDIPAFVASLPLEAWLAAVVLLFFQGSRINENIEGWSAIYKKLEPFLARKPVFRRDGAAAVAIDAIKPRLKGGPHELRLLGYQPGYIAGPEALKVESIDDIGSSPQDLALGITTHLFRIEADDKTFKISVAEGDVKVIEVS